MNTTNCTRVANINPTTAQLQSLCLHPTPRWEPIRACRPRCIIQIGSQLRVIGLMFGSLPSIGRWRDLDLLNDPLGYYAFWFAMGLMRRIKVNFAKYSQVGARQNHWAEVARRLLNSQGLQDVAIEATPGSSKITTILVPDFAAKPGRLLFTECHSSWRCSS